MHITDIMWKITVEQRDCWWQHYVVHTSCVLGNYGNKHTHTHTENTYYLLHLQFNKGYANGPQCYICSLPAVSELLPWNPQIPHSCEPSADVIPNKFIINNIPLTGTTYASCEKQVIPRRKFIIYYSGHVGFFEWIRTLQTAVHFQRMCLHIFVENYLLIVTSGTFFGPEHFLGGL